MKEIVFLSLATICMLITGCDSQHSHTHKDDNYDAERKMGWRRSIGTDFHAGNNEYLYLDEFSMEWSVSENGRGYLYTTKPSTNTAVWSFKGIPLIEPNENAIEVKDGTNIIATHKTGTTYEIRVIFQTQYYIKVFYKKLAKH